MQIPDPQIPKLARQLSPAERAESIKKTSETSGCKHGVDDSRCLQRKRDRIMDRRSESTAHRLTERASQHGKVWCGGGGRQTASATSSLDTLGIKKWLNGSYKVGLVAREFEQTVSSYADFYARSAKAHDFARASHDRCNSRKSSCFRRLSQYISSISNAE